jgi:HD-like signal output (HDOD) protein
VGSWIVDKWNLPEDIVVPISNHHQPENSKDHQELTWDLYWANLIAYEALGDRFHEAEPEGWRQQMERMIDLGPDRLDALIVNIRQEVEHIKSYMELA